MTYKEGYDRINNKYDELKAEIEAKEITEEYTQEMKDEELQANEDERKAELELYDEKRKEEMDNMQKSDINTCLVKKYNLFNVKQLRLHINGMGADMYHSN